jgi:hypothetical protein
MSAYNKNKRIRTCHLMAQYEFKKREVKKNKISQKKTR